MANEMTPNQAPQHMQSQNVPAGNHAPQAQPLDRALAELQRREKEIRKREESLKDSVSLSSLKDRAKSDHASVLKELGLDHLLGGSAPVENDPVADLRRQLEDMQNAQKAREQEAAREKAYQEFLNGFSQKKDDFELTHILGRERDVFEAHLEPDEAGEPGNWENLASTLENNILEQVTKLLASKKVSALVKEKFGNQQRHPLDSSSTLTTGDKPNSAPTSNQPQGESRQQVLDRLASQIKFT